MPQRQRKRGYRRFFKHPPKGCLPWRRKFLKLPTTTRRNKDLKMRPNINPGSFKETNQNRYVCETTTNLSQVAAAFSNFFVEFGDGGSEDGFLGFEVEHVGDVDASSHPTTLVSDAAFETPNIDGPLSKNIPELKNLVIPLVGCLQRPLRQICKRPIRVLSLFDGMATGLYVLDQLGIQVDAYYSSEIDENAISHQEHRYGDRITRLGCVTLIDNEKLRSFGKIDLLIGGSPCSDLSLVNPKRNRKGLYGRSSSGRLFFEFLRILQYLLAEAENSSSDLYWLFENTFSMEKKTLEDISSYLNCAPVVRCVSQYVPMKRKRYVWGNIPRVYHRKLCIEQRSLTLQHFLKPYRQALVDMPTLTTNQHSQRSGRNKTLPVLQDGKQCKLFITEVETLFGFAESFTDGPNLSYTGRLRLLGKSWCVPVIADILEPLKDRFQKCNQL